MQPYLDDREEAIRRARRAERIAHMRREKQLQEQRRQKIRKLFPLGVLLALILIAAGIMSIIAVKKSEGVQTKNEKEQQQMLTDDSVTPQGQNMEIVTNNTFPEQSAESDPVKENEVYTFEKTDSTTTISSENVISSNAILINESTNKIVALKGADERISPASMTKVLTVLVAAEHLTEADLDKTFTMTREIVDYAYVHDCSLVGFEEGEKVPVRDLFYGTILHSGADAAIGLAVYTAGSHEAFVDLMNEKLEAMGLSDSAHFTNCVGLYDANHYCTVYDMAVIMKAAVQNELCREFLSKHQYTTTPTAEHPEGIEISNWFLRRIEDKETGGEVVCAKTGYVVQSKNCAVSYGIFANEIPYICVTAGASSNWRCIYDHVEIYNRYIN